MKTRLFVEGHELDISPETDVPINLQVVDVKDLNKRVGDFTKTIKILGTKNNNKILGNVFNLQIDNEINSLPNVNQNYNPKRKGKALLQSNNIAFSEGYIQLRNITKNNDKVYYEIVFYGRLSDIITEIAGKEIKDLDMSDLNHTISFTEVTGSWDGLGDYIYPFVDYGHANIRAHGEVNIGNLKPAIKLKRYIDQIFEESGFTYDAPFFESPEFTNLYIPYNGVDDNVLTDEERTDRSTVASNNTEGGLDNRYPETGNDYANRVIKQYQLNDDVLETGHLNTSLVLSADELWQFVAPETRVYNLQFSGLTSLDMQYVGTNTEQTGDPFEARSHNVRFMVTIFDSNGNDVTGLRQKQAYARTIVDLDDDAVVDTSTSISAGTFNIGGSTDRKGTFTRNMKERTTIKEHEFIIQFDQVHLQEDDRVKISYEYYSIYSDYGKAFFTDGNDTDPEVRISRANTTRTWDTDQTKDKVLGWVRVQPDTFMEIEPIRGQLVGTSIDHKDFVLDEVQQKDLLLSTIKLFNLVAVPDENNERNLIIRQRDEFFESGNTLNWDGKVDHSRDQRIQPVRDSDVRRWVYSWKDGSDYYNEQYNDLTDRTYGDVKIDNNSEFGKKDTDNLDIIFEPAVVVEYENRNVLDLVVEFPSPTFKTNVRVENTDDIELLTGVGQQITIVVDGISYDRTITRTEGKEISIDSPINTVERGRFYGCVIKNRYDRLSIPSYKGKDDNIGQEPVETNPKILYFSGTKACDPYTLTTIEDSIQDNTYPILHHLNAHPDDNPTFDYNFGRPQRVFFDINSYPENNIYSEYHQQTLQEILDGSNVFTLYINASDTDIVNLKYNDKIYIDGQLYRVNRIIDYNLNKKQPAKFELIKL